MRFVHARRRKIIVVGLALLLTIGAVCFSLSSPSAAIASTTSACAQNMLAEGTVGCAEPMFMCNLGPSVHLVPRGLAGTQTGESVKESQAAIAGLLLAEPPRITAFSLGQPSTDSLFRFAQNTPIHLLNSVLSL